METPESIARLLREDIHTNNGMLYDGEMPLLEDIVLEELSGWKKWAAIAAAVMAGASGWLRSNNVDQATQQQAVQTVQQNPSAMAEVQKLRAQFQRSQLESDAARSIDKDAASTKDFVQAGGDETKLQASPQAQPYHDRARQDLAKYGSAAKRAVDHGGLDALRQMMR